MATTKSTVAKKATTKKTAAKKTTAARQSSTTAATTKSSPVDTVRKSIDAAVRDADETVKQYTAVAKDQFGDVVEALRGVVDISVGIPFVIQARVADSANVTSVDLDAVKAFVAELKERAGEVPSVDLDAVKTFLDEAKVEGHARLISLQQRIEPVADKFEAQYGAQVNELIETSRTKLRSLFAA